MKRGISSAIIIVISCLSLFPQTIVVIDEDDGRPIAGVAIFNSTRTFMTYSGNDGRTDLPQLGIEKTLCFQHFSYVSVCLSAGEIKDAGDSIRLKKKMFPIEDLVVSANRWEQESHVIPNRISVLSSDEIYFTDPQTAADLVASTGEVFVQKSQLGGGSPMIRGFATNRVLIVVDGVRMNNAIYREGNIQNILSLDQNITESAEVILGPGAIVYGSDAIGGVMDFHTTRPGFSNGGRATLKTNGITRYSTADREKTAHFDLAVAGNKLVFFGGISYAGFADLRMGSRGPGEYLRNEYAARIGSKDSVIQNSDPERQVYSGYSQLNTTGKLLLKVSERTTLCYTNHYSQLSDVPRYDRLIQYKSGTLRYGSWYYGPQIWQLNALQFDMKGQSALFDEMKVIAARQDYRESRHERTFGNPGINEQFEKVKIFTVNIDLTKDIGRKNSLLYYGFEYGFNDIVSSARKRDIISGISTPAGTRYPDGSNRYNYASAYAGYRTSKKANVIVNTGLRYNFVSLRSTITNTSFYNFPFTEISIANSAVTGAAGLVWNASGRLKINLNGSSGFRAPNLDDAGKVFDSAPGIVVVPNPGLKPEYATNIDLGFVKDFGRILRIEATGFHTWLNNAMVRDDFLFNGYDSIIYGGELSKVEAVVNKGCAKVSGLSLNLMIRISCSLKSNSTLVITEGHEQDGTPLRHAAPLFGSSHLTYERPRLKADFNVLFSGPKKFEEMPPSEISKPYIYATDRNGNPWSPGWWTLNIKVSYRLTEHITVNTGIENILDLRYRPYSSGIVSPGRNFIFSTRIAV